MEKQEKISVKEKKRRMRHILINVAEIISVGLAYYVLISIFDASIPCPIKLITGRYCPGCGLSRMCIALFHLDFKAAYLSNRFLFVTSPLFIIYFLFKSGEYILYGRTKTRKAETVIILFIFIAAVIFTVLRNTESFSYLAPM